MKKVAAILAPVAAGAERERGEYASSRLEVETTARVNLWEVQ